VSTQCLRYRSVVWQFCYWKEVEKLFFSVLSMSPGLEQQGEDGGLIVDLETSTIGVIKASAIGYLFKPDNLVAFLFFFQFFTKKTFET